jgi:hypothetical protein
MPDEMVNADSRQRRHMRRSALLLGLLALSFYAAYIAFAITHGHR